MSRNRVVNKSDKSYPSVLSGARKRVFRWQRCGHSRRASARTRRLIWGFNASRDTRSIRRPVNALSSASNARKEESPAGRSNSTKRSRSLAACASPRAIEPNKASDRIGQRRLRLGKAFRSKVIVLSLSVMRKTHPRLRPDAASRANHSSSAGARTSFPTGDLTSAAPRSPSAASRSSIDPRSRRRAPA